MTADSISGPFPSLILDVMGGDAGPRTVLEGVIQALPELSVKGGELVIIGDENILRPLLEKRRFRKIQSYMGEDTALPFRVKLIHARESIDMTDSIKAIRSKPNASINIGCQMAGKSYQASQSSDGSAPKSQGCSAFISAGHSGAVMASALLNMGRLENLERPAIAVKLPTLNENGCILIDVGANVDCKPEHLRDFAVMGAIYAQVERKTPGLPKVALLSNGEERKKGNELTRAAATLIETLACFSSGSDQIGQFTGYAEGKEIFRGQVDVVITDGFVGNVVLKSLEGLASVIATILKGEAKRNPLTSLGFLLSAGVFARFKRRFDYAEYGAAPLLGVAGYVFICHGRSNPRAIKNALLRARAAVETRYVERLEHALKATIRTSSAAPQKV